MSQLPRILIVTTAALACVAMSGCGDTGEGGADVSRGTVQSLTIAADESYTARLNGIEIAMRYDPANEVYSTRVKNETADVVCDVQAIVTVDGMQTLTDTVAGASAIVPSLAVKSEQRFEIDAAGVSVNSWVVDLESFTCLPGTVGGGTVPDSGAEGGEGGGGEGSEGGGGDEGSEGGGGGGEGSEGGGGNGEAGEGGGTVSSPVLLVGQPFMGVISGLDTFIEYDASTNAFRGTTTNNTTQLICATRVEVHSSVEFGPTIRVDTAPGDVLKFVVSADGFTPTDYSLHPEVSVCP